MRSVKTIEETVPALRVTAIWQTMVWGLAAFSIAGSTSSRYAAAETFVLSNGKTLEGAIIQTTRNGIIIKRAVSGMSQYRHDEIRDVIIDTPTGEITGSYVSWTDGVYTLEVKDRVVRVEDGNILGTGQGTSSISKHMPSEMSAAIDDTIADDTDPVAAGEGGVGGPVEHIEPILITGTAMPAREGEPALVYKLNLSHDADEKIVLVYATIADTARPAADFVAQSGVMTIEPGKTEAQLKVPLIDDSVSEEKENFRIYLSVDPTLAKLADRTIIATIQDDD